MNGVSIRAARFLQPARIVATVGLVAGLGFAFLVPPLAGYDESVHFLRAYQVSQGGLIATHRDHRLGGSMPSGLRTDLGRLFADGVYSRHDRTAFLDHLGDPPASGRREFFDFPSGAVYSAVPYAPAALFIAIGRVLGVSTLVLLYLGRIGNLLAVVGLLTLAVRRMPSHAWMLATVALLPVTVFQAAMISADGVTIALALLVVALALDLAATKPGDITRTRLAETAAATIALGLAKPPYILFALALVLPIRRHGAAVASGNRGGAGSRSCRRRRVGGVCVERLHRTGAATGICRTRDSVHRLHARRSRSSAGVRAPPSVDVSPRDRADRHDLRHRPPA